MSTFQQCANLVEHLVMRIVIITILGVFTFVRTSALVRILLEKEGGRW